MFLSYFILKLATVYSFDQQGVVHGDVYAHNILFHEETGDVKIGDFGAAWLCQRTISEAAEKIEVRAFGVLITEIASLSPDLRPRIAVLSALAESCMLV